MADGMPPRFAQQDGITVDLSEVYEKLRHGVQIRNRSSMKRLHKNSFVGTEAVGYLVKAGLASSRTKAVALGRLLQDKGYLRHVTDQSKFKDAQLYYRFYSDEDAKHASLNEVSLGTLGPPGVSPDSRTWGFAPHTAHNSLVLDLSFAEHLETELHAQQPNRRAAALEKLRERVRLQVSPESEGWDDVKVSSRTLPNGQTVRTRVWSRARPRGAFTTVKTEAAIGVSPHEFLQDFLDLEKRQKWDGIRTDGTIVEAVFTSPQAKNKQVQQAQQQAPDADRNSSGGSASGGGGSGGGVKRGGLLGMLTPTLPKPPGSSSSSSSSGKQPQQQQGEEEKAPEAGSLAAAYNSAGFIVAGASGGGSRRASDRPNDEGGGEPGGGGGAEAGSPGFTTLRPPPAWGKVDLSACPENMSIANFGGDSKKEETARHVNRGIHSGRVEECMLCSKPFSEDDTRDLHDCPSCGSICCSFCCSKRVFEVNFQNELRVCIHCYQESSRIKHPVGTLAYASSRGVAQDFLSMAEIKQALEDDLKAEMEKERQEEEAAVSAAATATTPPPPGRAADAAPTTVTPQDGNSGGAAQPPSAAGGGGEDEEEEEGEAVEELDEAAPPQEAPPPPAAAAAGAAAAPSGAGSALVVVEEVEEVEDDGGAAGPEPVIEEVDSAAAAAAGAYNLAAAAASANNSSSSSSNKAGNSAALFGANKKPKKKGGGGGVRFSPSVDGGEGGTGAVAAKIGAEKERQKFATCKQCGTRVLRTLEAIELHDQTCEATNVSSTSRTVSVAPSLPHAAGGGGCGCGGGGGASPGKRTISTQVSSFLGFSKHGASPHDTTASGGAATAASASGGADGGGGGGVDDGSTHGGGSGAGGSGGVFLLGGVPRVFPSCALSEKDRLALVGATAKVLFRTRSGDAATMRPRQMCVLQDSFQDDATGLCCVYEISVRHRRVHKESPNHVTAEVLFMAHAARPLATKPGQAVLTVVSQVDAKSSNKWISSLFGHEANYSQLGGMNVFNELATAEGVESLDFTSTKAPVVAKGHGGGGAAPAAASAGGTGGGGQPVVVDATVLPRVSLVDFELMTVLGRGGFGKVMQVRHKATNCVYAMKIFKKTELRKRRQVERTITERDILSSVRHPYIVQLSYAFQNKEKLYMVMDFVQGGDFFTFMRKFGRLKESWVQLYVCQIALALQHLHELDVVYRDLKPENVLMDGQGHAKLTDFGLSRSFEKRPALADDLPAALNDAVEKQQSQSQQGVGQAAAPPPTTAGGAPEAAVATGKQSRSYCGTEQYMAPEMLLQRGHGRVVDWWCLGLLMHEMLTGRHPFQGPSHYDTLRAMVTAEPVIDPRVSPTARALVRRLLIKDPKRRLGAQRGAWIEIRPHPFFNGLDWDLVLKRQVPAPYSPPVSSEEDTENFEDVYTKEKPVDSVVEPSRGGKKGSAGKGGLWAGIFGSKGRYEEEEDNDFEGFSFHGGDGKSVLDGE